ncbi:MAG: hypothetical protein ACRD9R_10975 [Pyrinomonadaceae bacterium]
MKELEDFYEDIIDDEPAEEFSEELADEEGDGDFGEDDEDDEEPYELRTAVLAKNDMLALISLKLSESGGVLVRVDPRQPLPAARTYEDSVAAAKWFYRSLKTSRRNGWQVVYLGEPLVG